MNILFGIRNTGMILQVSLRLKTRVGELAPRSVERKHQELTDLLVSSEVAQLHALLPKSQQWRFGAQNCQLAGAGDEPVFSASTDSCPCRFSGLQTISPRKYCQMPCNRQIICNCR